ncbi:hypothetical protein ACA910_003785 [Epithemia clementina (nom. ined.)]
MNDVVRTVSTSGNSPSGNVAYSDSRMSLDDETTAATATNDGREHHHHHALISADGDHAGPTRIPMETTTSSGTNTVNAAYEAAAVQDEEEDYDVEDDHRHHNVENDEEEEDDEYEYEYEDEDDAAFGGFLRVDNPPPVSSALVMSSSNSSNTKPAKIEEDVADQQLQQQPPSREPSAPVPPAAASKPGDEEEHGKKPQWKEPTREAVNMSLRAEKETSGSKRRLAQDLYRIMNKDTEETGFSLQPSKEDCMDKWTIKLFQFDDDSNLAKDMLVLGLDAIELEMSFPDQYPFEPPFVRVVQPRFKRQTGFVMNGAICMELLTKEGWNPVNDIESVIVSVRSLLVVGEGRLEAAYNLPESKYNSLLEAAESLKREQSDLAGDEEDEDDDSEKAVKRQRKNSHGESQALLSEQQRRVLRAEKNGGKYSEADAKAAYEHLSSYHKKKGWDTSGWWARKG